jgi:hypothetical protein
MAVNEKDPFQGLFTPTLTGRPPAEIRINPIILGSVALSTASLQFPQFIGRSTAVEHDSTLHSGIQRGCPGQPTH